MPAESVPSGRSRTAVIATTLNSSGQQSILTVNFTHYFAA